jgi:hypothetical protein
VVVGRINEVVVWRAFTEPEKYKVKENAFSYCLLEINFCITPKFTYQQIFHDDVISNSVHPRNSTRCPRKGHASIHIQH